MKKKEDRRSRPSGLAAQVGRRTLVKVRGIVQGVGFRPFIYQLALRHGLGGWVQNRSDGVEIEVSGEPGGIADFIREISARPPSLARIVSVEATDLPFERLDGFRIVRSDPGQARSTLISPDVSTCPDCLGELFDPEDRRYRYPFINCTNCGPRYTIIKDIPYDRDKTTMAQFAMCPQCRAEYDNPLDRRFHAQPNACWECGPQVWIEDSEGRAIASRGDAVKMVMALLKSGAIVAIKGLGGFHLAVNATDEAAVSRLRGRKIREEKPFAVMFSSIEEIERHCQVDESEGELLLSAARPIVLLKRRDAYSSKIRPTFTTSAEEFRIAQPVAPRNRYLGAFLPYTPVHFLLFEDAPYKALVMTSGNQSDEPIVMENSDARSRLKGIADYLMFHDREIYMRCDDSVTRVLGGKPRQVRRSRGYVPAPVFFKHSGPSVLGTGAELKNTVCLTRGNEAFLSQHIGDLENLETLHSFEHAIAHLERILEINPELVVHDLHPDYLSTRWALRQGRLPVLGVQHHHAHIASIMAEHGLDGPVIGLALDGTGFGTDGTIWGGEVLKVEGIGFERLGHFRHTLMPGGAMAIKEPWRMALSYLWSIDPEGTGREIPGLPGSRPAAEKRIILQMLSRRFNSPVTSSCGRLFDAVAALCGLRDSVVYEGQAAIELEQAIEPESGFYKGKIIPDEDGSVKFIIDPFHMIEEVVEDVRRNFPVGRISARFHNGMVGLLIEAARWAARICGLKTIALSGGVFQNAYLSERLEKELCGLGFEVYTNAEVPANDACIALGQAFIGARKLTGAV